MGTIGKFFSGKGEEVVRKNAAALLKGCAEGKKLVDGAHDPFDKVEAFRRSLEEEKFPLGVFYVKEGRPTFEETLPAHRDSREPLWKRPVPVEKIQKFIDAHI